MSSKSVLLILAIVLFIGAASTAGYFYFKYQSAQSKLSNPNQAAQQETQKLIDQMSKLIDLPKADLKNGEPTLATVLDKSKLKDQPFFANAENGDKVLIYTKAKKAFLYRPSTNKIINVAPVTIGAGQQAKLAIRNGSGSNNAADKMSSTIQSKFPDAQITSTGNANKQNYSKTIVVDLSGSNATTAQTLAQSINASVGSLPDGEAKPDNADLLIIVGSDQK
jgi:hypothetical protein